MRRRGGLLVAACLLVTACSSGGAEPAGPSTSLGEPADVGASADAGRETAGGEDGWVALPGLPGAVDEPIPNDAAVTTGTLANGLTYYVRENDNPGAKVDMRLAIRAGSVDETSDETGVAHFVEHMLFNGTERFPENELVDTLRSFGAAFGADVNAYTSFDETVYTLTVPNADESVELGLTVLEQWLSHATFDDDQVVAERGVVVDEWRIRTQSNQGRLFAVAEELFLAGTPYAGRAPIGTEASNASMPRSVLVEFYERWYRPDHAAVVVVGDIDVDEVVDDLERLFGSAEAEGPSSDVVDPVFVVDDEPEAALHLDPEQQTADVEVTLPLPAVEGNGTLALRARLVDEMILDALIRRLRQDAAAGSAPFDDVVPGSKSFVDGLDAPGVYAFTDPARVGATLDALLDEYRRAAEFGFDEDEVDLSRSTVRAAFDTRFAGRESTQDRVYAGALVEAFLRGAAYPSIEDEYEIVTGILDQTDADALTTRFRARWANSAPHVIVSAPSGAADVVPDVDALFAAIAAAGDRAVSPRDGRRDLPEALMERPDPVDAVSSEEVIAGGNVLFDPVRIVYPNGVTVIFNTNQIVEAQVFFQAASPGGSSLVPDDDVVDALFAADVVMAGGVAGFDPSEVATITAGTDTRLTAWIDPYVDHFAGSAAVADLEVLLQRVHLHMTEPRFDEVALDQLRNRVHPVVDDPASDAATASEDALLDARYPGELRYATLPSPDQFDTLDLGGVERVWRSRYGDASDWVFVFSGDIDIDDAQALTDAYLGTLPGGGPGEEWRDVGNEPPAGVVRVDVVAGTGDTAAVTMLFTSPVGDIDAELRVTAQVATELIQARLTDVIREELGESYSPSAFSSVGTDPEPVVESFVFVTGAPDRVGSIAELVVAELADIASNGPAAQEYSNAIAQVEESLNFVDNGTFVSELVDAEIHPDRDLDDYLFELQALDSVTLDRVREYVAEHLRPERFIQVTVTPR